MGGTTEHLVEIFNLSDLGFCAQAPISFNKSSTRDIRVPLSNTSGPAVDMCEEERANEERVGYR